MYNYTYSAVIKSPEDYAKYYNQVGTALDILEAEVSRLEGEVITTQDLFTEGQNLVMQIRECYRCSNRSCRKDCIEKYGFPLSGTGLEGKIEDYRSMLLKLLRGRNEAQITAKADLIKKQIELSELKAELARSAGLESEAVRFEAEASTAKAQLGVARGKQFGLYAGIGIAVLGAGYLILKGLRK